MKEAGGFFLSSLAFRWSELVELRSKVQRFDEWVTLQEVEILPTLVYFCMFDTISQDALVICLCDATKPGGPYTQIPYCDPPKFKGPVDNSLTYGIFMVAFLYIFLTNIQIVIIFYKSFMYNSFTLLHANIY